MPKKFNINAQRQKNLQKRLNPVSKSRTRRYPRVVNMSPLNPRRTIRNTNRRPFEMTNLSNIYN
jgi:hypothetical protein